MAVLKVRAIGGDIRWVGYYGLRRRSPGEEFVIEKESDFCHRWMEPIGWTPKAESSVEKAANREIIKPSMGAMVKGKSGLDKARAGKPTALSQMTARPVSVTESEPMPVEPKEVNVEDTSHNPAEEVI